MTTLRDLDHCRPALHEMLRPTLGDPTRHRMTILGSTGVIAIIPLAGSLPDQELYLACWMHAALERGVLIVA